MPSKTAKPVTTGFHPMRGVSLLRLQLLCDIKSSGQDTYEKIWGTSVHCPSAAADCGVGGGGEAHHNMERRGLGKFVVLPKSKPKEESSPRRTEI